MQKRIADLKAGDIVSAHGGKFLVTENARESSSHRPLMAYLTQAHGPSDCAAARSVCIEGECGGYFYPGKAWSFQGNHLAGKVTVA